MKTSSPTCPRIFFNSASLSTAIVSNVAFGSSGKELLYSWHQRRALRRTEESSGTNES